MAYLDPKFFPNVARPIAKAIRRPASMRSLSGSARGRFAWQGTFFVDRGGFVVDRKRQIFQDAKDEFGIGYEQIVGACRGRAIVAARRYVAKRLREEMGLSYPRIGLAMGGRDHTTILNLLRDKEHLERRNRLYRAKYEAKRKEARKAAQS